MIILDLEKGTGGVSVKPGMISFRADEALALKIGRAALLRQASISEVIRDALNREFDREEANA